MKTVLKTTLFVFISLGGLMICSGQDLRTENDTLPIRTLDSITVNTTARQFQTSYMTDVSGIKIYAGKRTNTVVLSPKVNGLAVNLGRTALAKISGLTMWEMDGAGTQMNIGSRGTDSHRSIEMNMRQNGYNTNSDMFGYPENHYSVPLQAVKEIQLVRGSAALQFGPQFGGMLNYKIKEGDSSKVFSVETEQTAGGYDFFNSFNAVSGEKNRLNYYAFYDYRSGKGWRDNARFNYHAYYTHFGYKLTDRIGIKLQFSRMDYVQQIAGGLTDQQFQVSAKQSVRARNYFQPIINIPAVILNDNISSRTRLQITSHGVFGERNSVQYINAPNIPDTINAQLGAYNPRQVDRDYYSGFTTEIRVLHKYNVGKVNNVISGGTRYFHELTKRKQKGVGTTGSDFDLTLTKDFGTDVRLTTDNLALFAENIVQVSPRFSVIPGARYELINTNLRGLINNRNTATLYHGNRHFPLFGAGVQYQVNSDMQVYGNISQAYRPYLYSNITPADRLDKIDPFLKDSKGYDIDVGYRGHYGSLLQFDLDVFYLFYGNKIGLVSQQDANGAPYLVTTNVGNSVAKGFEAFAELSLLKLFIRSTTGCDVRIFTSLAYDNARYTSGVISKSGTNVDVSGNRVENAPEWINKSGIELKYKKVFTNFQYSFTSESFNDAFNTVSSPNGVTGRIPGYHVWDWNFTWQLSKEFHLSASVNNFTDEKYFNRRITFYPGPGILPADGRTFAISVGAEL